MPFCHSTNTWICHSAPGPELTSENTNVDRGYLFSQGAKSFRVTQRSQALLGRVEWRVNMACRVLQKHVDMAQNSVLEDQWECLVDMVSSLKEHRRHSSKVGESTWRRGNREFNANTAFCPWEKLKREKWGCNRLCEREEQRDDSSKVGRFLIKRS